MTTDEVESHQKSASQKEETGHDNRLPSPDDDHLRPRNRNSAGRGLSRLFSSFLKRRSQCESEGGDRGKEEEEEAKAPIADPEPELRVEGEAAPDQHSVSSTEGQVAQEEEKVKNEEKEGDPEGEGQPDKEKTADDEVKAPRPPRRPKTMQIKVTLLDDTTYECQLDTWMDLNKEIRRQVHGNNYNFTFNVKFYPADPAQLSEDITRYYLCLQLRKDILQGRLPCSFVTLALLGSYALQSELGEYDPEVHGNDYGKEMKIAPGQTKELEDKMMELHRTYRSMTPAQADLMFLENAKKLSMYGVDLHQAKDLEGVDIMLGVCSSGLLVYKDKLRINRFPWPKVLKVSYKRSSFFIKIRPSEVEHYESAIGFKLPNYKAAKKLWKVCVEHHTFFRLTSTEMATTPRKFLALGSKFRYSGRTQAQTRQASSLIDRPAPCFQRSSSKRNSRSLDEAMASTPDNKSSRPVSAPLMSPVSPGEALSFFPFFCVCTFLFVLSCYCPAPLPSLFDEYSLLLSKDVDKTQTEIMRHHTSISELKRSFMESVPEPRPSEWDKRLSTNSPLRTLNINGQLQPASPVLKTQTVTISDVTNSLRGTVVYKDVPLVHTETKTITYESAQPMDSPAERESGMLLSAQTITSETISTTTTTQITKTVKGGISETRIEKRIVITGDTEIDHDKALARAIKEAKEQHPDMSVTKVVVHQETEITPE
uniref:Protein 4.1 n=1 Tax=Oryzias sinensis TaxID=183150 RepID=A0A8C7XP14_9TELE